MSLANEKDYQRGYSDGAKMGKRGRSEKLRVDMLDKVANETLSVAYRTGLIFGIAKKVCS